MRKKLKAILSAAIITTIIIGVTPLPASSNTIIPMKSPLPCGAAAPMEVVSKGSTF